MRNAVECKDIRGIVFGGGVSISVAGFDNPPLEDWLRQLEAIEKARCLKILTYAASSKPLPISSKQALSEVLGRIHAATGQRPKLSLVLQRESAVVLSFARTFAIFNRDRADMKVFGASSVESALRHLDMADERERMVREEMDRLAGEMKVGRIFGLPGSWARG